VKSEQTYRPRRSNTCDFDFGTSANLVGVGGVASAGLGAKDGTYSSAPIHNH